jgi:hypothetical protein
MFDHKHLIALLSGALLLHLAPKLLNIFQAIQQKRLPHTEKIVPEQKKKLARLSKVLMTEVLLPNMADAYGKLNETGDLKVEAWLLVVF